MDSDFFGEAFSELELESLDLEVVEPESVDVALESFLAFSRARLLVP